MKKLIYLLIAAVAMLNSCTKNNSPAPENFNKNSGFILKPVPIINISTYVYTTGYYRAANGKNVAAYWRNNAITKLTDSTTNASGQSIVISGSDIYVAGYRNTSAGVSIATYWKNGVAISLSRVSSIANDIFVNGTDVYVAGQSLVSGTTTLGAALWKNNAYQSLAVNTLASGANAVTISGTDVYVAGYTTQIRSNKQIATYWKNGVVTYLTSTNNATATDIAIYNNSVYISGNEFGYDAIDQYSFIEPKYWLNGTETNLPAHFMGAADHIYVSSGTIYISGYETYSKALPNPEPSYWVNGTIYDLPGSGEANSVTFNGGYIYTATDAGMVFKNTTVYSTAAGYCQFNDIVVITQI